MEKWIGGSSTKPDWDTYYLAQAFLIAQKSIDESTAHGAILVDKNYKPLSIGYNGPISGMPDNLVPQNRPDKYAFFLHAEENALLNFFGSKSDIKDSTMYVTGRPCSKCLRMMIQKGIGRIIHSSIGSNCVDSVDMDYQNRMIENSSIEIIEVQNKDNIINLLNKTIMYLNKI